MYTFDLKVSFLTNLNYECTKIYSLLSILCACYDRILWVLCVPTACLTVLLAHSVINHCAPMPAFIARNNHDLRSNSDPGTKYM